MLNYTQALILGLLQGVSELFPISSLGHSVILPRLLGWSINQQDPLFLSFLVATHLATALVLLAFFWKDWAAIVKGLGRSLVAREINPQDTYAKIGWLLVVGTIPAGLLGLLFEESLRSLFASPQIAAFFLILNGALLYAAELLRRKAPTRKTNENSDAHIAKLSWNNATLVGAMQALALFPGLSRSGSSMAGSLLVGLSNEEAARYSFLLATPIILAASLLKIPDLFASNATNVLGPALAGAAAAAVGAYFAIRFLMRYFETNRLTPFAIYSSLVGIIVSVYFLR